MDSPLDERWTLVLEKHEQRERLLESEKSSLAARLSGLKDVSVEFQLARTKLEMSLTLLESLPRNRDSSAFQKMTDIARKKARQAVRIVDELQSETLSEDQKDSIREYPEYREIKELISRLILQGGGVFFEVEQDDVKRARSAAGLLVGAINKFLKPDDGYAASIESGGFRASLRTMFPNLLTENPQDPPYGIEEGEEEIYHADRMKMPLSQAILYLEEQLLPDLEAALVEAPGDPDLQHRIGLARSLLQRYRQLKFFPRSTPLVLEKNFYTDWVSHYTVDGELLVTIDIPVSIRSGTNLERMQDLVRAELVKRVAGKGICPELDEQYRHLKSISSGIRGSSRWPSTKLKIERSFSVLKSQFPALRRLENRREFKKLVDQVAGQTRRAATRRLAQLFLSGRERWPLLP